MPRVPISNENIIGSGNGLVPNRQQAIIWTNNDLVHWGLYASIGLSELSWWSPLIYWYESLITH